MFGATHENTTECSWQVRIQTINVAKVTCEYVIDKFDMLSCPLFLLQFTMISVTLRY